MDESAPPPHVTDPSGQNALIDAFVRYGTEEKIEAGTVIIRQGEIGRDGYFLRTGRLAVFATTSFGEVQLAQLEAPALVGEIAALAGLSRTANVRTLDDSILLRLPGEMLLQAALHQSEIFLPVVRKLGAELEKLNNAIGLYTDALNALERQRHVTEVAALLANPPAQMAGFAEAFGRFAQQIVEKKRQQDELASAALIQQSFLPKAGEMSALSTLVTMHAHMSAARHVGGDFYDALRLDDGRILIVIGDVCGKGIPASLFMAVVITTLRSVLRPDCDAAYIAAAVNSLVCKSNPSAMFATAIIAILDTHSGTLQYCNCGHCPLMLMKADGSIQSYGKTGIPIGILETRSAAMDTIAVDSEDTIFLYSDGISEAMNTDQEEWGEQRLLDEMSRLRGLEPAEFCNEILAKVSVFASGAEQSDDITCIALRMR